MFKGLGDNRDNSRLPASLWDEYKGEYLYLLRYESRPAENEQGRVEWEKRKLIIGMLEPPRSTIRVQSLWVALMGNKVLKVEGNK
jgi:hypothetical protein